MARKRVKTITDLLRNYPDRIIMKGHEGLAVSLIQRALNASGTALLVDGEFGENTRIAVTRFQISEMLEIDGKVGPETAAALDHVLGNPLVENPPDPGQPLGIDAPWVATCRAFTGTKELPGKKNSPAVMAMAKMVGENFPIMEAYCDTYTHDDIPWCGLFMAAVMAKHDIKPAWGPRDTDRFLWAKAWLKWGTKLSKPRPGCVVVFSRKKKGGHVAMCEKVSRGTIWIRGGNQSDMVNVTSMSMTRLLGARWPKGRRIVAVKGETSNSVHVTKFA